jgi:DNA-binding beta-propeller fold protein YncE
MCSFSAVAAAGETNAALAANDVAAADVVEWVDGQIRPLPGTGTEPWLGTPGSTNGPAGFFFGVGPTTGPRHFRVGFTREISLGTVVTRGKGRLSVLRSEAAYPGDPAKEADWLSAERLRDTQISVWVLPPGTKTRALRWSAEGAPAANACPDLWRSDSLPEGQVGWFGGLYAFSQRLMDVAPYAEIIPVTPGPDTYRLADGEYRVWRNFGGPTRSWNVWETDRALWGAENTTPPLQLIYAWPKPVTLAAAGLCFPGVSQTRVEAYAGPAERHPREAPESAWTAALEQPVRSRYPAGFDVEWLGLGKPAATTAIRLTGLKPVVPTYDQARRLTMDYDLACQIQGQRAWLGETLMLADLGNRALANMVKELTVAKVHPPIPVRFTLKEPGYVTLVIEDAKGNRVRNLISETYCPAGENTVWWDGLDDHRAKNMNPHGAYEIDGRLVEPGEYRVRGLVRGQVDLRYEFTVYNPVNPPWRTADRRGQWLSDHTPPSDVLYVPGEKPYMLIGSKLAEGAHGLVWTDLEGNKIVGTTALGGWAGAAYLAYDAGPKRNPADDAYAVAIYGDTLYLRALRGKNPSPMLRPDYTFPKKEGSKADIAGLAVFNGTLVVSAPRSSGLLVVDAAAGRITGTIPLENSRGVAFAADGALLCVTPKGVLRIPPFNASEPPQAPAFDALVTKGLEDPQGIALDKAGNIYVSDRGNSHQVKVFSTKGELIRTVGKPGRPTAGPYEELHMNNPGGITVTDTGDVWVAEEDYRPKRVSVWSPEGKLRFAKYGPSYYGGGGTIDPLDKTRFYYWGMEFKLDWERGTDRLVSIYHRPGPESFDGECYGANYSPDAPVYLNGRQYMVNVYNGNPISGPAMGGVWLMRDGKAELVAAVGIANALPMLQTPEILALVPKTDKKDQWGNNVMNITPPPMKYGRSNPVGFAWSDLNLNGKVDPDEVTFAEGGMGSLNITRDLTFVSSLTGVMSPVRFTKDGVPVYDITRMKKLLPDAQTCTGSAGDQVTLGSNGDIALQMPLARDPCHAGFSGVTASGAHWFYPNKWPGLHSSQTARPGRIPDPGEMIGTTRVLGFPVTPKGGSDAGELWGVNANSGVLYLFTTDGLFVSSLFKNGYIAAHQGAHAVRGMLLNEASQEGEAFYPTITQTPDGQIYLTAVEHTSSIVRVDGLNSIRRLPPWSLTVTPQLIEACQQYEAKAEAARVAAQGRGVMTVGMPSAAPAVDGDLSEWANADWVAIDSVTRAAAAVVGDRLVVAYHTTHADLLKNSGAEPWQGIFKTGGGLDVMLGLNRPGNKNGAAVEGDLRLIVAMVDGKPRAVLYRPVVPGTPVAERVPFSSPSRTIYFDRVTDISAEAALALGKPDGTRPPWAAPDAKNVRNGTPIELSVPLKTLGLEPRPGLEIAGDLGILKGDGAHTTFRSCWHNQATGLTQDVPGEALLQPALWGLWRFAR